MTNGRYILSGGGRVREEPDLFKWAAWFESADRVIEKTQIGEAEVSTVFLGLDHRLGSAGPPLVFETMIFSGEHDGYQRRYATIEHAREGHSEAVRIARGR